MDTLRHNLLLVLMPMFFLSTRLRTQCDAGDAAVFIAAACLSLLCVTGKLIGIPVASCNLGWKRGEAPLIG
jgi:Kef-type K+ transport system membrane component KefB